MDTEKNISVTLKQPEEKEKKGSVLSVSTLLAKLKKYFLLWIVVSVITALLVTSISMIAGTSVSDSNITALVSYNYEGIKSGLDPKGNKLNVNKIKSPKIIESALTELDMSLGYVEMIRRNIKIEGIRPDETMDKITLYKDIYTKGGSAGLTAAEELLNIGYHPTYYIVSLDYSNTKLELTESKELLDCILKKYQDYFFTTYGYNQSLGNSVVAVDYKDYDYPAAIDVLNSTLSELSDYVSDLSDVSPKFRSGKTGYSFSDLETTIETLRTVDLYSLSSYVTINNVTNDKSLLLTYYEYKIEQLKRRKNVYQSELDAITSSIDNYEKDKLLIFGENSESLDASYSQNSEKYDDLIEQKIKKQKDVSKINQNIEYYKERIETLNSSNVVSTDENIKETETRLAELNERINDLIDVVNETSDEYYENVTFARAYNILVPATGAEYVINPTGIATTVIMAEALLFVLYIMVVFISAVRADLNLKADTSETDTPEK